MNTDPLIVPQRCYDAAVKSVLKKCTYGSGLGSFGLVTSFSIGRTGFLTSFGGLMTFGGEVSLSKRRGRRSIIAGVKDEKLHLCSNKVWPTDRGVMKMLLHLCNFYIECRGGLLVQFILFIFCTIDKHFYIKISYQRREMKQQSK